MMPCFCEKEPEKVVMDAAKVDRYSSWAAGLLVAVLVLAFGAGIYSLRNRAKRIQEKRRDEQIRWWVLVTVIVSAFGAVAGVLYKINQEHYRDLQALQDHQRQFRQILAQVAMFGLALLAWFYKYQSKSGGSGFGFWDTLN